MSQSISSRIAQVQRYINEHPADAFRLGIIYGMLNEIRKDAEEQEKAYSAMCQLYLVYKPEVLDKAIETMSDILSGKNLKED